MPDPVFGRRGSGFFSRSAAVSVPEVCTARCAHGGSFSGGVGLSHGLLSATSPERIYDHTRRSLRALALVVQNVAGTRDTPAPMSGMRRLGHFT